MKDEDKIIKQQTKILWERAKHRPMDDHVRKYIAQLHEVIKQKDKKLCELFCENSKLILENASLKIDLERIQNTNVEGK